MAEIEPGTTREVLTQFLDEVEQFDPEMFVPHDPRKKSETLIGVVKDEFCKKLYSAASFYRREGRRMAVDIEESGTEKEHSPELHQIKSKHDVLIEIFWHLLKTNHNAWHCSVGVRKNWEFVQIADEAIAGIIKSHELPKFLKRIMEDLND